jgi:indoleamine 2,3-dioxygenase
MHFYIHTLPPTSPIVIPAPITLPVLQVSRDLQLPPVITYSDDVLYNWRFTNGQEVDSYGNDILPTISNISAHTLFTGTSDEAEFYLSSARMELKGVEALELMRSMMDEMFVGDDIATRRITEYLHELAEVIRELGVMLMKVKEGCKPDVFYHEIRPWFRGEDSSSEGGGKWVFEGLELDESLCRPTELSGASAGQSSLVHALDVFLGVDQFSHSSATASPPHPGSTTSAAASASPAAAGPSQTGGKQPRSTFLKRMQGYMPRHHRAFLNHLANTPRPLRDFVLTKSQEAPARASFSQQEDDSSSESDGQKVLEAYNAAVQALKVFRDKHMIIVTLYIVGPARRKPAGSVPSTTTSSSSSSPSPSKDREPLKGTGGTDLVKFLKSVRDQTKDALLVSSPGSS